MRWDRLLELNRAVRRSRRVRGEDHEQALGVQLMSNVFVLRLGVGGWTIGLD